MHLSVHVHVKHASQAIESCFNGVRAAVHAVQALLTSITAEPNAPIDSLCFVTEAERKALLHTFNATQLAPSELMHPGQTIHGMLEHWAAATPNAPAVRFEARN